MKTIIIDDSASAIEVLAEKLNKYDGIEIVGTATNGSIGLSYPKKS